MEAELQRALTTDDIPQLITSVRLKKKGNKLRDEYHDDSSGTTNVSRYSTCIHICIAPRPPPPSMYPDIYEFPITSFYNLRVILGQQKQYLWRTNIDKVVMHTGK